MAETKSPNVERRFLVRLVPGGTGQHLTEGEAAELLGQLIKVLRAKSSDYNWPKDTAS